MQPDCYTSHSATNSPHRANITDSGPGNWTDPCCVRSTRRFQQAANQENLPATLFIYGPRPENFVTGQSAGRNLTGYCTVPRFSVITCLLRRNAAQALDILLPALLIWIVLIAPAFGDERADPLEPFNRVTLQFNSALDKAVLKPVTRIYTRVTPGFIRSGVSNFFSNVGELKNLVNHLLQLDIKAASVDAGRFVINSSLGVAGLFEVAQPALGLSGAPTLTIIIVTPICKALLSNV